MIKEEVKKWLIKATEDFNIVKHELSFPQEEVNTTPACFHCQQVVEKLLKAYLVSKNEEFGKTHDLEFLKVMCMRLDNDFRNLDLGNLKAYAVEVRYPDEFYTPSIEEARECFKIALDIKEFIFRKLYINEEDLKV